MKKSFHYLGKSATNKNKYKHGLCCNVARTGGNNKQESLANDR